MKLALLVLGLICTACVGVAHGFLGDSEAKIAVAYGSPVRPGKTPFTFVYERQGYRITVEFENGKSVFESWSKVSQARLTGQEVEALLKVQADGKDWIETPAHANERCWVRVNAWATYLPNEAVPVFAASVAQSRLPTPALPRSAGSADSVTDAARPAPSPAPMAPVQPPTRTDGSESNRSADTRTAHSGGDDGRVAVRCNHTTKKGVQCSRMTTNPSGLCWQHGGT